MKHPESAVNLAEYRYPERGTEFRRAVMQWVKKQDFSESAIDKLLGIIKAHPLTESTINSLPVLCNNVVAQVSISGSSKQAHYFLDKLAQLFSDKHDLRQLSSSYFEQASSKITYYEQQIQTVSFDNSPSDPSQGR